MKKETVPEKIKKKKLARRMEPTAQLLPGLVVTASGAQSPTSPGTLEQEHVHAVYDRIATHFSSTRYKVPTLRLS
jgi:hypothetical protein